MKNENTKTPKTNILTSFVGGARKGFTMSMNNMMPNVLFAFALIQILNLSGLSDIIGKVFGPVMGVFGLPGIAAAVVVAGLLSTGGGVGAAASLALSGDINAAGAAILLVGIMMFGSCIQYMGRVLGTADVENDRYGFLVVNNIAWGFIAMFVTHLFIR